MSSWAEIKTPQVNSAEQIMQVAFGYVGSICLHVAAKLGIADLLRDGPAHIDALASQTSVQADALYRVLRALASMGIFTEAAPRSFALTPTAELLRSDVRGSLRAVAIWMADPLHLRIYAELPHSVKTGETTIEHVFGKSAFEYLAGDPAEHEVFNEAMTSFSQTTVPAILEAYDFSSIGTLVDVGGGHGYMLRSILQKYPVMKGILFEVEPVAAEAKTGIDAQGLASRCQIVQGDFFSGIPSGADAYIMKHIIHNWNDEKAIAILRNCRRAFDERRGGKVIVVDAVIAAGNEPNLAKFLDLEMLAFCGSRERTEAEFRDLFAKAELQVSRIVPTKSPVYIIEGVPRNHHSAARLRTSEDI